MEKVVEGVSHIGSDLLENVTGAIESLNTNSKQETTQFSDVGGTTTVQAEHNAATASSAPITQVAVDRSLEPTDKYYSCAYEFGAEEDNITKLIHLITTSWNTSQVNFTVLHRVTLPRAFIYQKTRPAFGQSFYFQYARCGFNFRLQVTAPYGYAGLLALAYAPPSYAKHIPRTGLFDSSGLEATCLFNLPHTLLDIAKQSEVGLTVPYVHYQNYADFVPSDDDSPSMGCAFIVAITNLMTPPTGVNSIDVNLYGAMLDLDLQCPCVPRALSFYSDEGRKNILNNKLPPKPKNERVPMSIIIPPGPGSFNASNSINNERVETLAIAGEGIGVDYATAGAVAAEQDYITVLQNWTQILEADLTSNKTPSQNIFSTQVNFNWGNFQRAREFFQFWRGTIEVKAIVVTPNTAQGKFQLAWTPHDQRCSFEEARNSIYVVQDLTGPSVILTLPFTSRTWIRTFDNYGTIHAFVVNRFIPSTASATACKIILYARAAKDFQLFCPKAPSLQVGSQGFLGDTVDENQSIPFLNFDVVKPDITGESHSKLSVYAGRHAYFGKQASNVVATGIPLKIPIKSHLGLLYSYAYFSGTIVITIQATSSIVIAAHTYHGSVASLESLAGAGMVIVQRNSCKSFCVPFYSPSPLRSLYEEGSLGTLYAYGSSEFHIYIGFRDPSFFFPVAPYKFKPLATHTVFKGSSFVEVPIDGELQDQGRFRHEELMRSGDVELNPGPLNLLKKNRGIYSHYGVQMGDTVFHVASQNLAKAIVDGKVPILTEKIDDSWEFVSTHDRIQGVKFLESGAFDEIKFSIDNNCETWAKEVVGDPSSTQGARLKTALTVVLAVGFISSLGTMEDEAGWAQSITNFFTKITDLVCGGFQSFIVRTTVKTVLKLICYLIMYAHAPTMLNTGVLVALITMDCTNTELDDSTREIVSALVDGRFRDFLRIMIRESGHEIDAPHFRQPSNQGLREFNVASLAAKNFSWWMEKILEAVKWIKNYLFPSDLAETISVLEENRERIIMLLALGDEHLCLMKTDHSYSMSSAAKNKHLELVDSLSELHSLLLEVPGATTYVQRIGQMVSKLQQLTFEPSQQWKVRQEPIGIWVTGAPGCGKSFLVHQISKELAKHFGWQIYSHPVGSKHMDGYVDQEIHVFDDFGQCKEDDEYQLICQLISSCPFIVPKASVESKGTHYNAKVVLTTTNRNDFSSCKLFDKEALERRFPIRLHIRSKENCSINGKLDATLAFKRGVLQSGHCWERNLTFNDPVRSDSWQTLDLSVLVKELIEEIEVRAKLVDMMNHGNDTTHVMERMKMKTHERFKQFKRKLHNSMFVNVDDPKSFFDWEKLERSTRAIINPPKSKWESAKFFFNEMLGKFKAYLEKNRIWLVAFGALGTVVSLASVLWTKCSRDQSFYDGQQPVRLTRNYQRDAQQHVQNLGDQGRLNFEPLRNKLYTIYYKNIPATALAIGKKELITYAHDPFEEVEANGVRSKITNAFKVTIDEQPMDLQVLQVDTNQQFKSLKNLVYPDTYRGDGYLIWKIDGECYVQPVQSIIPYDGLVTKEGTTSSFGYAYEAKTFKGSCGGVLVAFINGALRILGIHTSGNGVTGFANRLFPFLTDQGMITNRVVYEKAQYHQPRRSKFSKSPFFTNPSVEPAILSNRDKRLAEPIDDLTIHASLKYRGNVFDPPKSCFTAAKALVGQDLAKVVRKCSSISFDEAVDGTIPIDWNTSPGLKYRGFTKRELISADFFKFDVNRALENPKTVFVTYLKDELRPIDKVRAGKTRGIEACPFDFTVAYRMVCGAIYKQIYNDKHQHSGIAVGINPYTQFCEIMRNMYDNCLCLDFSKFDGSLSDELMRHGVEILASFHTDPTKVIQMHETVINSTHLVSNELWEVNGGMPSGSPCTSVLNSICNNLAAYTVALSCGADPHGLYIISYGDDLVISSRTRFDLANVVKYYKLFFGMEVTNFDKSNQIEWLDKKEISFLKRRPGKVDWFGGEVGVLDLTSMMDKIQWTKGFFKEQLHSFLYELVLHGPEVYSKVAHQLNVIDPSVSITPYEVMRDMVKSSMENQGKSTDFSNPLTHENEFLNTISLCSSMSQDEFVSCALCYEKVAPYNGTLETIGNATNVGKFLKAMSWYQLVKNYPLDLEQQVREVEVSLENQGRSNDLTNSETMILSQYLIDWEGLPTLSMDLSYGEEFAVKNIVNYLGTVIPRLIYFILLN